MWRKICREELRQQRPVYLVIFGLLLLSGVFGVLVNGGPQAAVQSIESGFAGTKLSDWMSLFSIMGMYVLWAGGMVFFSIYTIYRFSKSVFGKEGAFWLTLPASPRQVLLGKLLTPLVWLAGMAVLAVAGVMIFMVSPLFSEGQQMFLVSESGAMIVCMLASQFLLWMGTIYGICFAIAAGHLPRFRKHAVWATVGVAVLLFFAVEPLAALILQAMTGLAAAGLYSTDGIPVELFYAVVGLLPVVMLLRMGLYVGLILYLGEKKLDYIA
ncbi:hypothetical protein H9X85_10500 [Anaerotignum lactatifermentans]|uniref:ABC transporter permease n=1 Tax=Anaerotignum lactatifermentans TaxID=160404 RepID=A0ABS2GB91_9FIRM|nr:hypothetical protein [Anaerotignum lactatifermentans]MBM6829949.1 hypothetical protein [Anaerotignum lactatifermentans]MBM6878452.1 hypothetical protein [Anaerotignum lactatifermentans]MBM6951626.1 hypothetical protein [Anaerotignum lactatifermentans]